MKRGLRGVTGCVVKDLLHRANPWDRVGKVGCACHHDDGDS